jgi:hypothetical protein
MVFGERYLITIFIKVVFLDKVYVKALSTSKSMCLFCTLI